MFPKKFVKSDTDCFRKTASQVGKTTLKFSEQQQTKLMSDVRLNQGTKKNKLHR